MNEMNDYIKSINNFNIRNNVQYLHRGKEKRTPKTGRKRKIKKIKTRKKTQMYISLNIHLFNL